MNKGDFLGTAMNPTQLAHSFESGVHPHDNAISGLGRGTLAEGNRKSVVHLAVPGHERAGRGSGQARLGLFHE